MSATPCCNASYTQKIFMQQNGKRRPLSHNEFEELRGIEATKGNYFWVPGVIFRYICGRCGNEVAPKDIVEYGDAIPSNKGEEI